MFEQPNNQGVNGAAANQPRPGFMDRVDIYYAEKNNWKKMNGGSPISPDIDGTLELLRSNVHPTTENLAAMVRASVLKYAVEGQTFEQIWTDKISEGANYVGVVDGVFGFYRGEEKLPTNNKPLLISAMPVALEFREKEREMVKEKARQARQAMMADFKAKAEIPVVEVTQLEVPVVAVPIVPEASSVEVAQPAPQYQFIQTGTALELPEMEITAGQL